MPIEYNRKLTENSQNLRKNMTPEEKHLWYDFLKKLPITVNRQKSIGNYIVDFYISSANLVIEIDGAQHEMEENKDADRKRDEYLNNLGIKVLRYSNVSINKNFNLVCDDIIMELGSNASEIKR